MNQSSGGKLLRLFVKGDRDVAAVVVPLASFDQSDAAPAAQRNGVRFEIEHEAGARVDCIMQAGAERPAAPSTAGRVDDDEWLRDHSRSRLFQHSADVVVLALEPNVTHIAWRHRASGFLLDVSPGGEHGWPATAGQWLNDQFSPVGLLEPVAFKREFAAMVAGFRRAGSPAVVVLNCCSIDPADRIACYRGVAGGTNAVRVHQFNLALLEISAAEGISIIDVDRIVGELGADSHVTGFLEYSAQANEAIRREVLRVIEDLGLFESELDAAQEGGDGAPTGIRGVVFPFVHRLSDGGTIVRWHKQEGDAVGFGDDLLDIELRFAAWDVQARDERIRTLVDHQQLRSGEGNPKRAAGPASHMLVRLTARESGVLRRIDAPPGSIRSVEDVLGVITIGTAEDDFDRNSTPNFAGTFPVVVNNVL